jgi:hypothetical protein
MTTNTSSTDSGLLLSRLCVPAGMVSGVLAVVHPLLGAVLSTIVLVWALAGLRGTGQRGYRIALFVSLAALVMNVGVLLASLSVGTVVTEPGPAVKIS